MRFITFMMEVTSRFARKNFGCTEAYRSGASKCFCDSQINIKSLQNDLPSHRYFNVSAAGSVPKER